MCVCAQCAAGIRRMSTVCLSVCQCTCDCFMFLGKLCQLYKVTHVLCIWICLGAWQNICKLLCCSVSRKYMKIAHLLCIRICVRHMRQNRCELSLFGSLRSINIYIFIYIFMLVWFRLTRYTFVFVLCSFQYTCVVYILWRKDVTTTRITHVCVPLHLFRRLRQSICELVRFLCLRVAWNSICSVNIDLL